MKRYLGTITTIIFVLILTLIPATASLAADSGTVQKGITLINKSTDKVHLWIGHDTPANQKAYTPPGEFFLAYAGLKYTQEDAFNNLYYDDSLLVNAMNLGDIDPYPSHISQKFTIKGWIDSIAVWYTAGKLELKVTYVESAAPVASPTPAATAIKTNAGIAGINGRVEFLAPGATEWDFADLDTPLPPGTHIKTGIDSNCVISFGDMSTFVLKPESEVIVTTPPDANSKVNLTKGNIWVNMKKMIKDGTMDIEMNQGVAGIKGTTLVCQQLADGASIVKVIEGTVEITAKANGAVTSITDGEMISVTASGLNQVQPFDAAAEAADWDTLRAGIEDTSSDDSSFPVIPVAIGAAVVVLVLLVTKRILKK